MTSKGGQEIEAAKRRLAAAQAEQAAAVENVDAAHQAMRDAKTMIELSNARIKKADAMMEKAKREEPAFQSRVNSSVRETIEAEESLKDAETRWGAINGNGEGGRISSANNGRNKRRKKSVSRGGSAEASADDTSLTADQLSSRITTSNVAGREIINLDTDHLSLPESYRYTILSAETVLQISVRGCGVPEVNGNYVRGIERDSQRALYTKRSPWKGEVVTFMIFSMKREPPSTGYHWVIGIPEKPIFFYITINDLDTDEELPPKRLKKFWKIFGEGTIRRPSLTW